MSGSPASPIHFVYITTVVFMLLALMSQCYVFSWRNKRKEDLEEIDTCQNVMLRKFADVARVAERVQPVHYHCRTLHIRWRSRL